MPDNIHHTESGERLSFFKLFKDKEYEILIPIIQRDYAQGRETTKDVRNGFLNALKDYLRERKPNRDLDFIYGSLITDKDHKTSRFVPLDGQQRLTTLFLLHWYLATKEKKTDSFRKVFAKTSNSGQMRSKFSYETRTSASEFCDALVSANIEIESLNQNDREISNLSKTIKDQNWYFLSWRNDPTIQGMLVVLDDLHDLFINEEEPYYELLTDSDNPIITFQFLKLEEFGLTDDLYIKMNARGKPLTSFENFKAKFEKQIKQPEFNTEEFKLGSKKVHRSVSLHEYFSHKIDTEWANFFWAYAKEELGKARDRDKKYKTVTYDDIIMNFLKTYAVNFLAGKSNSDKQVRDLIRTTSEELTFNQFSQYQCFDPNSVTKLITLLDILQNGDNKAKKFIPEGYYYDEEILEKFLTSNLQSAAYGDRIMFHAYTQFLINWESKEEYFALKLKRWMRIIHNLTENTAPYNNEKEFINSIKGIDNAINKSNAIHGYLIIGNSISGFDHDQNYEEQQKVHLIEKGTGWDVLIYEAEQHGYFKGQIGFLLRLCGITDYFSKNKNCDWDEQQDANLKQSFKVYLNKAFAIFDSNGVKPSLSNLGDYIWERALLAIGDYLIGEGRNKSFLIGKDRDISWKRLLKGDKHESHYDIVKTIFDAINTSNIKGSLEAIISNSNTDGWRNAFIDTAKLFDYIQSGKRYFRLNSNHGSVLFKRETMKSKHAELYSLKFFKDHLEGKQIEPFEGSYYYETSGADSDHLPCACINKWGDSNYEIDVLFKDGKFEVWFLNTESKPISKIISELLTSVDFDMKSSNVYELHGYVVRKDTDEEALDFINSICLKLKSIKL